MRQLPMRVLVDVTTLTTNVPSGDDETGRRMAKLAARDEDLPSGDELGAEFEEFLKNHPDA